MSRKRSPGFSGKNRGVTPLVAAPGVTHPSDATVCPSTDNVNCAVVSEQARLATADHRGDGR